MSVQGTSNLASAREALAYVKGKIRFGPANNPLKLQPDAEAQLKAMGALLRTRSGEDAAMASGFVVPADALRVAQAFAENAERFGGGNCDEHAAVAYIYLRRQGVFPIDWAIFTNKDHAFVIIGRSSVGSKDYALKDIPKQPWFADAVICDAYWGRSDYWSKLIGEYDPQNIGSRLHQETQSELHQWVNVK